MAQNTKPKKSLPKKPLDLPLPHDLPGSVSWLVDYVAQARARHDVRLPLIEMVAAVPNAQIMLPAHFEHCVNALQPYNAAVSMIHRLEQGDINIDVKGSTL